MEFESGNSRRTFVKSLILAGIAAQLPWLQSCSTKKKDIPIPDNIYPLDLNSFLNLHSLLDILFPEDGNGPGAIDVKADHYILWILRDQNLDPKESNYLTNHLKKFNLKAVQTEEIQFHEMNREDQENFVAHSSEIKSFENFFACLLNYIFEALLLDPQYQVNPENIGWKWLEHNPGYPRPTTKQLYPTILNKKHEI